MPRAPSNASALARAINSALSTATIRPSPRQPMATADQIGQAEACEPTASGLPSAPRNRTEVSAGVQRHDFRRYDAQQQQPRPTGGPVGYYGTCGPIGPWGSWK